jgi:hypothetical protein
VAARKGRPPSGRTPLAPRTAAVTSSCMQGVQTTSRTATHVRRFALRTVTCSGSSRARIRPKSSSRLVRNLGSDAWRTRRR